MKKVLILCFLFLVQPAILFAEYEWSTNLSRVRYSSVIPPKCDYRLRAEWKSYDSTSESTVVNSLRVQLAGMDVVNGETKRMYFSVPPHAVFQMASSIANDRFFQDGYETNFSSTYNEMISDGKGPRAGEITVFFNNSGRSPIVSFSIPGFSSGSWGMNSSAFAIERQCSNDAVTELMYYLSR